VSKSKSPVEEEPQFGPRMMALTERQRKFVQALFHESCPPHGYGQIEFAVREAGYGTGNSNSNTLSAIGGRLITQERIKLGIAEYSQAVVRSISPEAIKAVRELIKDKKHPAHARALQMILDRVDPVVETARLTVEHYSPPTPAVTAATLAKIAELSRMAGVPQLPAPVDAEFRELPPADEA
jgi:hypothetical protein